MRLALAVFLADKALHPIVQVIMIVSSVIFQWCYHIDGDGWQLMCSVVYIWWDSSFGMYAVVTDCDRFCKLYNLQTSTWALLIKIYVNFRRENDLANLKDAVIKCLNL